MPPPAAAHGGTLGGTPGAGFGGTWATSGNGHQDSGEDQIPRQRTFERGAPARDWFADTTELVDPLSLQSGSPAPPPPEPRDWRDTQEFAGWRAVAAGEYGGPPPRPMASDAGRPAGRWTPGTSLPDDQPGSAPEPIIKPLAAQPPLGGPPVAPPPMTPAAAPPMPPFVAPPSVQSPSFRPTQAPGHPVEYPPGPPRVDPNGYPPPDRGVYRSAGRGGSSFFDEPEPTEAYPGPISPAVPPVSPTWHPEPTPAGFPPRVNGQPVPPGQMPPVGGVPPGLLSSPNGAGRPIAGLDPDYPEDWAAGLGPPRRASTTGGIPVRQFASPQIHDDVDDEEEVEEDGGYGAAALAALIWCAIPVAIYAGWALLLAGRARPGCIDDNGLPCASPRVVAWSDLVGALPYIGIAVALSVVVALILRWATTGWRSPTVGFSSAVVGAGAVTVLWTVFNGG